MYASVFCSRISPHGTRHSPHGIKHIQYSLYRRVRPCKAPLILGFRAFIRNITFFYIRMSSQIIEILVLIHYHLVSMIQFVVFNPDKASKLSCFQIKLKKRRAPACPASPVPPVVSIKICCTTRPVPNVKMASVKCINEHFRCLKRRFKNNLLGQCRPLPKRQSCLREQSVLHR